MAIAKKNELPNFIKARSPKRLRVLMMQNNARLVSTVQYFDIQVVGDFWYAWYYEPFEKSEEFKVLNGIAENITG